MNKEEQELWNEYLASLLQQYFAALAVYVVRTGTPFQGGGRTDKGSKSGTEFTGGQDIEGSVTISEARDFARRLVEEEDAKMMGMSNMDNITYDPPGTGRFRIANATLRDNYTAVWEILDKMYDVQVDYDTFGAEVTATSAWFPQDGRYVVEFNFDDKCITATPVGEFDPVEHVREVLRKP